MVVEAPTSSQMFQPSDEDVTEMAKLMSDGKRNYICNQPHLALDCFVELCEKLAKWHGQESEKCVEAYLFYGKTLLDIARLENGVLGHAIKETPVFGSKTDDGDDEGIKEGNTEDEEDVLKPEDIRSHVERAMREDNLYNVSTEEEEDTNTEGEDDDAADEKGEDGVTSTSTTTNAESCSATIAEEASAVEETTPSIEEKPKNNGDKVVVDVSINCEGSDEDDADDVSNLELSWEMLELTSVICKRQLKEEGHDHKAVKSTLAEAKHGLAQISLEMERYEDATNDFTECLDLYKDVLDDKNDRVIAEGHYNIALALSFDKKYLQAIKSFERAVAILKAKVIDLELKVKDIEGKEEKTDKDITELEEWKKEINELNDLIVLDMMAKIEDAHESKKLLDDSINKVKNAASEIFSTESGTKNEFDAGFSETSNNGVAVHDCSDNIRNLKRKSDDETSEVCDNKPKQKKSEELEK